MDFYVVTILLLMIICVALGTLAYRSNKIVQELVDNNLDDVNKFNAELQKHKNKSVETSKKYATSLYLASKPCSPLVVMKNQNKEINSKDQYYFFSIYDPTKRNDAGRTTTVAPLLFTKAELEKAANRTPKNLDDLNEIRMKYDLSFIKLNKFI